MRNIRPGHGILEKALISEECYLEWNIVYTVWVYQLKHALIATASLAYCATINNTNNPALRLTPARSKWIRALYREFGSI
ncbi:unnamed protein product [Danaus chrysippus]|uniref:(African queen) hypothetical protein n=1 Tax=Danaus chrysippus TaxID=151541 RepID=A0A8J2WB92_9NEOP|nr:unnamed protein product [Danaus chrysippus]